MAAAPGGKIITFYSYKGGTGRSMAPANVAWILASNGRRVLAIDWDLEAPGLHHYFHPFLIDRKLTASDGVIDFLTDYLVEAMTPLEEGQALPADWYVTRADVSRYAISLDWKFPSGGALDLMPAGRQGPTYATRVTSFNWQDFYDRFGGGTFLEAAKQRMRAEYDYILIDSRTGVSDTAGICTVQMPDMLVVCFTLNTQSIDGAAAVASSVHRQRRDKPLAIFPVPMRVEITAEKERLDLAREEAQEKFAFFLEHLPRPEPARYWDAVEVMYMPFYAFEEILATFGDKPDLSRSVLGSAERLTGYLSAGTVTRLAEQSEAERQSVLGQYKRRREAQPSVAPLLEQYPELRPLHATVMSYHEAWSRSWKNNDLLTPKLIARLQGTTELLTALLAIPTFRTFWEGSILRTKWQQRRRRLIQWSGTFAGLLLLTASVWLLAHLEITRAMPGWSSNFDLLPPVFLLGTMGAIAYAFRESYVPLAKTVQMHIASSAFRALFAGCVSTIVSVILYWPYLPRALSDNLSRLWPLAFITGYIAYGMVWPALGDVVTRLFAQKEFDERRR